MFQTKKQDKAPEKLSEVEKSNLPNKEFKVLIIKMFSEHGRRMDEHIKTLQFLGFPGGTVVKNPPANAGDTGSSPGLGRSHTPRSN